MEIPAGTGQFGIRRWQPEDAAPFWEAAVESVAEVSRWMPWCHPGYALDEAQAWMRATDEGWRSGEMYDFCIHERQTGWLVGGIGLNRIDRPARMANLGYWVRTSYAGQGAATEAARLVARFGFEKLGLLRIELVVAVENLASQRVATKLGALREGLLRNRLQIDGVTHHAFLHSLVPEDMAVWPQQEP
jgi:RimJ/RimL family protein N-acetyltransferase